MSIYTDDGTQINLTVDGREAASAGWRDDDGWHYVLDVLVEADGEVLVWDATDGHGHYSRIHSLTADQCAEARRSAAKDDGDLRDYTKNRGTQNEAS